MRLPFRLHRTIDVVASPLIAIVVALSLASMTEPASLRQRTRIPL
jgi:hypothetical protein